MEVKEDRENNAVLVINNKSRYDKKYDLDEEESDINIILYRVPQKNKNIEQGGSRTVISQL